MTKEDKKHGCQGTGTKVTPNSMDKLTPQQRHTNMAAIRGKDTKPEMIVRRGLWKRGFRYRLNHKRLRVLLAWPRSIIKH